MTLHDGSTTIPVADGSQLVFITVSDVCATPGSLNLPASVSAMITAPDQVVHREPLAAVGAERGTVSGDLQLDQLFAGASQGCDHGLVVADAVREDRHPAPRGGRIAGPARRAGQPRDLAIDIDGAPPPSPPRFRPSPSCHHVAVLDHVSIQCADPGVTAAFYDTVLATIGGRRIMEFGDIIGYGLPPAPDFWIGPQQTGEGFRESHIAFSAPDRASVRAFFEAAKGANAEVLHEPRLWPEYHPNYYGVFVRDPDGNNIEAVCHNPE